MNNKKNKNGYGTIRLRSLDDQEDDDVELSKEENS